MNIGDWSKARFEALSWVITDIRKNSETAAANTFISAGCYKLDVVASVLYNVIPPLLLPLSLSLPHCLSKCLCDMWIVSHRLWADVALSCVVIACQMTTSAEVGARNTFPINECFHWETSCCLNRSAFVKAPFIPALFYASRFMRTPRQTSNWGHIEHLKSCLRDAALMNK